MVIIANIILYVTQILSNIIQILFSYLIATSAIITLNTY
jgi:hypothetical protein